MNTCIDTYFTSFKFFFFFNDTATTEIYTLSLHDALPISANQHGAATIGIRPEHLRIAPNGEGGGWPGTVSVAEHLGSDTFLYVDAGALGLLTVRGIGEIHLKSGDPVWLSPDPARLHRFDKDGMAIRQ